MPAYKFRMKKIISDLKIFLKTIDKRILIISTLFISVFIFTNYYFGLNNWISKQNDVSQYICWYLIFLVAFSFGYGLVSAFSQTKLFKNKKFILLLLLAPLIFSWKMVFTVDINFTANFLENDYWNSVAYWPYKIIGVVLMLLILHRISDKVELFYGLSLKNFNIKPYVIMLLIMLPLIAAASTQPDFLAMYPKFQKVEFLMQENRGWHRLLYELSYGSDFFTIELFFRGFLILAFAKWVGKDAVLPMALFYCTIHFGKPIGECISSYFGGIILGVVILNTRTIIGGLLVHVGIAWLMELGGYLGSSP